MNINLGLDLFIAALLLSFIIFGRVIRGPVGFIFISIGIGGFVWSGIDSATKLFGTEWSFAERLYHFGWVWVGIFAAYIFIQSWRVAVQRMHEKEDEHG